MARLQRKKARSAKRKASGKKPAASAADQAGAGKSAAIAGSAKELGKRAPLTLRKASAAAKSVPGKASKNYLLLLDLGCLKNSIFHGNQKNLSGLQCRTQTLIYYENPLNSFQTLPISSNMC